MLDEFEIEEARTKQAEDNISEAKFTQAWAVPLGVISAIFFLVGLGFFESLDKTKLLILSALLLGALAIACSELLKISTRLIEASDTIKRLTIDLRDVRTNPQPNNITDELAKITELNKKGVLSDQEFAEAKARLIR